MRTSWIAVVVVVGWIEGAGVARAGDGVAGEAAAVDASGSVVVPLVGLGGRPAFCGTNQSDGRATPQADGGYRVTGLAPGPHVVHLELTDERIDVLVTVAAGEDLVVPPVIVRGPCRELALLAPADASSDDLRPAWLLRIGRRYQASTGMRPAVFERDRGLMRIGAERRAEDRADHRQFTRVQ
ncbi:MAG TPA: hypothetical protein VHE35_01985 [Kofleriaceae bacterium]|nr:hypothetical protein [Kofleriaceae bacterium]